MIFVFIKASLSLKHQYCYCLPRYWVKKLFKNVPKILVHRFWSIEFGSKFRTTWRLFPKCDEGFYTQKYRKTLRFYEIHFSKSTIKSELSDYPFNLNKRHFKANMLIYLKRFMILTGVCKKFYPNLWRRYSKALSLYSF